MNPRSEIVVLSSGAPPCTASRATTAVRSPLALWCFWPKPLQPPWPESWNPITGISRANRALRVCLLRSRRGTAPPPNSPPSSSGSISGSLQLRRGRKHREREHSPPLLLAGTCTPGLGRRSTRRWKEEVEMVRKRAAPLPNSAGNVAGEPVNFRPEKSRFARDPLTRMLQYPVSEIFQFWKFP